MNFLLLISLSILDLLLLFFFKMLTFEEIIQGSSRRYPFYLYREGIPHCRFYEVSKQDNLPFDPSKCWTVPDLVGVESQFSSLLQEIQDLEVYFDPVDLQGYFPDDYRIPCYEALFNLVHFQVQDQGYESAVKEGVIGCFVEWICHILECDDDKDIIDNSIIDIRRVFTDEVNFPDGIALKEIIRESIYVVWRYAKPAEHIFFDEISIR